MRPLLRNPNRPSPANGRTRGTKPGPHRRIEGSAADLLIDTPSAEDSPASAVGMEGLFALLVVLPITGEWTHGHCYAPEALEPGCMALMPFNATIVFVTGTSQIVAVTLSDLILVLSCYHAYIRWKQQTPVNGRD